MQPTSIRQAGPRLVSQIFSLTTGAVVASCPFFASLFACAGAPPPGVAAPKASVSASSVASSGARPEEPSDDDASAPPPPSGTSRGMRVGAGDRASGCKEAMVAISVDSYKMGSEDGARDERPVRPVAVGAFCMDRTEVTSGAYAKCVEAGACTKPGAAADCNGGKADRKDHPINCVDLAQARAYCKWDGKRLPTEEEWELAARGLEARLYPWGAEAPVGQACWNRKAGTCAVGSHPQGKSPFGIHDMAGNVWEWTASGYSDDYGSPRESKRHVVRGGGWNTNFSTMLRGSRRMWQAPTMRVANLGFRCAS